jgi:hypothetical protein
MFCFRNSPQHVKSFSHLDLYVKRDMTIAEIEESSGGGKPGVSPFKQRADVRGVSTPVRIRSAL